MFVPCLELPQSSHVIAALKAGGLQPLIQAALDAGQSRGTCPDHGHFAHHAVCGEENHSSVSESVHSLHIQKEAKIRTDQKIPCGAEIAPIV